MLHPVLGIDELVRLVIGELVQTSPRTAVSFALTCRSLEEPTLSSLWNEQFSLTDLLKVLPNHTWVQDEYEIESIAIESDPSAEDWTRLRRYASWMRGLHLGSDGNIPRGTFLRLSRNSPGEVLCPKLEWLHWDFDGTQIALTYFHLFLSPHLKCVTLNRSNMGDIPWIQLTGLISSLPSSLEELTIMCGPGGETLSDATSSLIRRCGPSLRRLRSHVPLSGTALHHAMQLPNLRSWIAVQEPPRTVSTYVFPSLEQLRIDKLVALPWLHLLTTHEKSNPWDSSPSVTPHQNVGETLTSIYCPEGTVVDSSLFSSLLVFRGLVTVFVDTHCHEEGVCTFRLTDDDMKVLSATLPHLEHLRLGRPCSSNSCSNTVASLLSISIHCLGLTRLAIHFNTRTIVGDMQHLLDGDSGCDSAKCGLRKLVVGYLPLGVRGEDIGTLADGFKAIFPSLTDLTDYSGRWLELESRLCD